MLLVITFAINVPVYNKINLDKCAQILFLDLNVIFLFAIKEKIVPKINPNAFAKEVFKKYFPDIEYAKKSINTVSIPTIKKLLTSFPNVINL